MSTFLSILISGVVNGSMYGLLGASFGLIFWVTGRFHFAYGLFYTVAAFVAAWTNLSLGWPIGFAVLAGLAAGTVGGVASEVVIYRPLERRSGGRHLLGVFIASLGLVIAGESGLQIIFPQPNYSLDLLPLKIWRIGPSAVTMLEIVVVAFCWLALFGLTAMLARTRLGRQFRAVEVNPELSNTIGVRARKIAVIVFGVGSLLGGALGILEAAQFAAVPQMGDAAIVYAFVIAFLARGRNPLFAGLAGVVLGLFESTAGIYVGEVLQSAVVFLVLFIYVAMVPYGGAFASFFHRFKSSKRAIPSGADSLGPDRASQSVVGQ
jgi:branched-chain amino acid transport system permease protein